MKFKNILIPLIFFISCNYSCNKKDSFKLCHNKKHPYYYPSLGYKGGFYEIKQHFNKGFQEIKGRNNSGIVKIKFIVNCKGEIGNLEVETYSLSYEKTNLNSRIIEQFINLIEELKYWIPAVDAEGEKIDSFKFYAFKIVDGKLKEILPK